MLLDCWYLPAVDCRRHVSQGPLLDYPGFPMIQMHFIRNTFLSICIAISSLAATTRPADEAYLGLLCVDAPGVDGAVVNWIYAGPLEGDGYASKHVRRGDVVLAVNGKALSAADIETLVLQSKPGDVLKFRVRRTEAKDSSPARPGDGKIEAEFAVVLARKGDWVGPYSLGTVAPASVSADDAISLPVGPTKLETLVAERSRQFAVEKPIENVLKHLATIEDKTIPPNQLSRVRYILQHPLRLYDVQEQIVRDLQEAMASPAAIFAAARKNLDVSPAGASDAPAGKWETPTDSVNAAAALFDRAQARLDAAFAKISPESLAEHHKAGLRIIETYTGDTNVFDEPDPKPYVAFLQSSLSVDFAEMFAAAEVFAPLMTGGAPLLPAGFRAEPGAIPEDLRGAIKGDILAIHRDGGRVIVYGSVGPNEYDLSKVSAVIDPGGDDVYRYGALPPASIRVIVDASGDDRYESDAATGPAGAIYGISIIVDHLGNDAYAGGSLALGGAVMGAGVILDRAGDDTYTAGIFTCGAAVYGLGAIIDLGGNDAYQCAYAGQGHGGPRGLGVLLDQTGRDLYRADGPTPSAYGTPANFQSFSQGVGTGIRGYDTGGIGALVDMAGEDRYQAGEFAQGGAYFFAIGILRDAGGNDLYYGNRYAQGFGCHQAFGALVDDGGNDTYYSMTAAGQGSAWDESASLFLDRAGDDAYLAEDLAIGSAAHQSVAVFLDLGGRDTYRGGLLGRSVGNNYHFDETGVRSLSLFLDAGSVGDLYPQPGVHKDGTALLTDTENPDKPADARAHGFFIDMDETWMP